MSSDRDRSQLSSHRHHSEREKHRDQKASKSEHHDRHSEHSSDHRQRDELDDRLRRREKESTRTLAAKRDSRMISEIAKRLRLDPNKDQDRLMDEIRKKSRSGYLNTRASKQLELYEEDLKDEKTIFSDVKLTKSEKDTLEYREKVLTLTKGHIEAGEKAKIQQYFMPDSRELEYIEVDEDENQVNPEQKQWEKSKFEAANLRFGSGKDRLDDYGRLEELSDYELLKDDKEFLERVKRGDTFDEYRIDHREREREAKDRERKLMHETRRNLPVFKRREELLQAIAENQIIIVQGQTGCGKTTQIPQYLHEEGYTKTELKHGDVKIIGCTQPRRVAAMSVAARVSQEIGSKLGHTVGYSIRFEDCTSEGTVIKYMTDGMLLRELLDDPVLSKYSVMMVDEAHERTLHTDILLTLLKDVTRARSDFRLVISSATLDEQKFAQFFGDPPIFRVEGRLFHVKRLFKSNDQKNASSNMIDECLRVVLQIHRSDEAGDILVFLPGQEEIEELHKEVETQVKLLGNKIKELLIRPIYANLPTDMQAKVFEKTPDRARKLVIATNIAETSLTIDGIVFVVDPGFCKQNRFSSKTGMETLAITRISKASADQRAGRAGRNRPGTCFRLYTRDEFNDEFEENTQPEIQRLNLANVVLLLKTMRIEDVLSFEYIDRPPREALTFAIEQLTALGALDRQGELTHLGRRMAEFPVEPKMSKAIIASESYGCSEEVLTIMSMLSVNGSIFFKPKDKAVHAEASRKSFFSVTGDHLMLLKVYNDWAASNYSKHWCFEKFIQYKSMCRARDVREQLEKLCEKVEVKLMSNTRDTANIRKAILGGFFYNVARISREGGSYRTIKNNQPVYIHPTSAFHDQHPRWVLYHEIKQTSKEYMRTISEIEPLWLVEVAPCFYNEEEIEEMAKKKMPKIKTGRSKHDLNPKYGR